MTTQPELIEKQKYAMVQYRAALGVFLVLVETAEQTAVNLDGALAELEKAAGVLKSAYAGLMDANSNLSAYTDAGIL